ncbi:hypothetical protein O9992_22840 [Vibrio lentus]|nr:hypothetical protein [Vibrio lentus]
MGIPIAYDWNSKCLVVPSSQGEVVLAEQMSVDPYIQKVDAKQWYRHVVLGAII